MAPTKTKVIRTTLLLASVVMIYSTLSQSEVLPEATTALKITLTKKPTTRPMTIAYIPKYKRYYIADGGLAAMGSETEAPMSKSQIHAFDDQGHYLQSALPGYDNRSIYYNPNTDRLETITYNVSSDVGFAPNQGAFSIDLAENGDLLETSKDVFGFNPAFGDAATIPSYDAINKVYYAKQSRSNKVYVVDAKQREKLREIDLDFTKAGVAHDDVGDSFIAYTGVTGEELVLLDIDHKAALVFDLSGKFVAKSELPKTLKLHANNHYSGLGYTNGLLFTYHEPEGEFGTYYGFKVLK